MKISLGIGIALFGFGFTVGLGHIVGAVAQGFMAFGIGVIAGGIFVQGVMEL